MARVVDVHPAQSGHRAGDREALAAAEQVVAEQGAGEVQGRRQVAAGELRAAPTRGEHRDAQSRLQGDELGRVEPIQQARVRGAAAQEHVLAVVEVQAVAGERVDGAAEAPARLEQDDLAPRLGALQRGGDPRQSASHDGYADPGHHGLRARHPPARLRAASHAFSPVESAIRSRSTAAGSAQIRSSTCR